MYPDVPEHTQHSEESTISRLLRDASPTQSLPEQIAERLRRAIIGGAVRPGARILEQSLARQFDVSRGPVREALRILEHDGLVQILPRRGAQVTPLSSKDAADLFRVTASLFGLAARRVALDGTRDDTTRMVRLAQHLEHLLDEGADPEHYLDRAHVLYSGIIATADNPRLQTMLASLTRQILRYAHLDFASPERRRQSADNWLRLAHAMNDGRPADAEEAARRLVEESRRGALRMEVREQAGG